MSREENITHANVTSRKKKTRTEDSDNDTEYNPTTSIAKKKKTTNRGNPGGQASTTTVRRNLNLDFLPKENKNDRSKVRNSGHESEEESLEAVTAKLLESHLRCRHLINSSNCFEQKTVLDVINNDIVRHESMADMAMILNSAAVVYGFRVDRCYLHVQDTRGNIISSFPLKSGLAAGLLNESVKGTPKKKFRDDLKQQIGDWKARLNEDGERELTDIEDEEEDATGRRHIPEDDTDSFLDSIPVAHQELNSFLNDLMEQRKTINNKVHSVNTHLVEDAEELMDRTNKELKSNEYYQKAVSRYGEGNSASMLLNNAKYTSGSQAYLIHSRITTVPSTVTDSVNSDFVKNIKATLGNSLSAQSKKVQNDLLPVLDDVYHESDAESENENGPETAVELGSEQSENFENDPLEVLDAHSIVANKKKETRRSIVFRGKNAWLVDDIELDFTNDSFCYDDKIEISRLIKLKNESMQQGEKGNLAFELELLTSDLKKRSKNVEIAGIDEDVRELDNLWNSQIVRKTVTAQEAEEMARQIEKNGGTREEINKKKLRILQPGEYIFFVDTNSKENPLIPVDTWSEEGSEPALEPANIFYDSQEGVGEHTGFEDNDDVPPPALNDLEPVDEDPYAAAQQIADEIRAAMDRNTPRNNFDQALDLSDIADVPVNPGMILEKPDEAIRNLGKEDDAHWKGGQQVEGTAPAEIKKQKKSRDEKHYKSSVDSYWCASTPKMRRGALNRFNLRSGNQEKLTEQVFFPRPTIMRAFQLYECENFFKVHAFNGTVNYPGYSFDSKHRTKELIKKPLQMYSTDVIDPEGNDIIGIEWMRTLRGCRVKFEDNSAEPARDETTSPLDQGQDDVQSVNYGTERDPEEDADFDFPDPTEMNDDNDTEPLKVPSDRTISPDQDQDFNEIITKLPWVTQKNRLQEIRELQAAEDVADDGEIADGLEGCAPIIIKNTTIDQSKVKAYLRNILTNRLMDKKCLTTVAEAANDQDFLDQTVAAIRDITLMNPGQDISIMNRSFEFKDSGIDPLEVSRIVFAPPDDLYSQGAQNLNSSTNQDGPSQEALKNAVVLSDFNIEGNHCLSSIMACLPFKAQRINEKNMHVALLVSIALQMCNENTLHCFQNKTKEEGSWMEDFLLQNGASQTTGKADASRPTVRPTTRLIDEVIQEVDEDGENTITE